MEYLKKSGLHYTFFHCSVFLDSFPAFIQGEEFAIIGDHKYPVFFTNTIDLAENIYNAIDNETAYNKAFTVQGTEGLSFPEAAKRTVYVPVIASLNGQRLSGWTRYAETLEQAGVDVGQGLPVGVMEVPSELVARDDSADVVATLGGNGVLYVEINRPTSSNSLSLGACSG